jgi:hypothetical protein
MSRRDIPATPSTTTMDLSHLRREARTALELAVVAMVPEDLLNRLAASAGLLEAIGELPTDSPPLVALVPKLVKKAQAALAEWRKWQERLPQAG